MPKSQLSTKHAKENSGSEELYKTFDQLSHGLLTSPLPDYEVANPTPEVLTINHVSGNALVLIGKGVWKRPQQARDYANHAETAGTCLVCVGAIDELDTIPPSLNLPSVLQLCLPVSNATLRTFIKSVQNLFSSLENSRNERQQVEQTSRDVKHILSISRELNGERDIEKLLNLILRKARAIANADAGSIYTFESTTRNVMEGVIEFRYTQNDSIRTDFTKAQIPVSERSIVGNAINIPDLYLLSQNPDENPFRARHDRSWDLRNGYESHSMLTLPIFDISHQVIGVIQLINRKNDPTARLRAPDDFKKNVVPFDDRDIEFAEIVAKQAGIALENATMHNEIQKLFDGFVNASVHAIESRDPTTSGHSHRVAELTVGLAQIVDQVNVGPYTYLKFDEAQIQELKYASLLHDFGKIGVRENVLVKAKKLYPWQMDVLLERFEVIKASIEVDYLNKLVNYLRDPGKYPMEFSQEQLAQEKRIQLANLQSSLEFILKANEPTVLEQGGFDRLKDIANFTFRDPSDRVRNFLLTDELKALSISRGSLTAEEFQEIQSHVTYTFDFLRKIPWGKRLSQVPHIAAKHHEKLDGTGYPGAAQLEEIPPQTRMMTIADIFDALTASDRPYKKAVPVPRALEIMEMEVKGGKLDQDLLDIFIQTKMYMRVIPSQ
jgi:HD-GYP domain-containing protein (c-di-GMP phosphodiesterase class II)